MILKATCLQYNYFLVMRTFFCFTVRWYFTKYLYEKKTPLELIFMSKKCLSNCMRVCICACIFAVYKYPRAWPPVPSSVTHLKIYRFCWLWMRLRWSQIINVCFQMCKTLSFGLYFRPMPWHCVVTLRHVRDYCMQEHYFAISATFCT